MLSFAREVKLVTGEIVPGFSERILKRSFTPKVLHYHSIPSVPGVSADFEIVCNISNLRDIIILARR
jgi:hypothetical protein